MASRSSRSRRPPAQESKGTGNSSHIESGEVTLDQSLTLNFRVFHLEVGDSFSPLVGAEKDSQPKATEETRPSILYPHRTEFCQRLE